MPRQQTDATHYIVEGTLGDAGVDFIIQRWEELNPELMRSMFHGHRSEARAWFYAHNTWRDPITGERCDGVRVRGPRIHDNDVINAPGGNPIAGTWEAPCPPPPPPTPPRAAEPPAPPSPPAPPAPPAPEPRDPFFALPQHVSPNQQVQLRVQDYLLGGRSDPADFAARRQVDRRTAAGTWEGRDPMHLDGQGGQIGYLLGQLIPPFGPLIGAVVGTGADLVTLDSNGTNLQTDLVGRQPNARSRVNMLEGWQLDATGIPQRINPGDGLNQPDESHDTRGLIGARYTLSVDDPAPNWDTRTQARISSAIAAPNAMVGYRVMTYLRPQINELYTQFHASHDPVVGQRLINTIAASAGTDLAQMSGMADGMKQLQDAIIAEGAANNVTLRGYDLTNPTAIPDLQTLGVHLTARSYEDIRRDPGFADNQLSEADYNRLFAGRNLDSFYSYARTGQNTVTRDLGLGGVDTPSRSEVIDIARDGIGLIDRSPETRAAFLGQVRTDPQFGLIISKSLNDMIHQPQAWGFPDEAHAIAYADSLIGHDLVQSQFLQPTATPQPDSLGRTRDEAAVAAAFAARAGDGGVHSWLNIITTHPIDRQPGDTNPPGTYAQAVLHQFSLQGAQEPGFNAIATAGNFSPAERTQFHTDITRVTSYEVRIARGDRVDPEDAQRAQTDALAARGVRRYTAVDAQGRPLPGQPVGDGIRTTDGAVVDIQAAGTPQGRTLAAVRDIMSNQGSSANSLEALGAYDRSTAINVVLESMARSPRAFNDVMDNLKDSGRHLDHGLFSGITNLFAGSGIRGQLADEMGRAARQYHRLMEREARGEVVAPEEYTRARRMVEGYIILIDDAQAGRVHLIQNTDDRGHPIGRPHAPRTSDEYRRAAEGAVAARDSGTGGITFVGDDGKVQTLSGPAADAARRAASPQVRGEQYDRGLRGQDSIVALLQMIGQDDTARGVVVNTIDGITTGSVISRNPIVTSDRVAAAVVDTTIAAMPEQNLTGIDARPVNGRDARSVTIRPDGAARIQASQPGLDAARIQADGLGTDLARIQAGISAQTANVGSGSRIDTRGVPTKPGGPTGDLVYIIGGIIQAVQPQPPGKPDTPITHDPVPGCPDCPVPPPPLTPPVPPVPPTPGGPGGPG